MYVRETSEAGTLHHQGGGCWTTSLRSCRYGAIGWFVCLAVLKGHPVLHHSADYIFWSVGINESFSLFGNGV